MSEPSTLGRLAGRIGGSLWLVGALAAGLLAAMPGTPAHGSAPIIGLAVVSLVVGCASWLAAARGVGLVTLVTASNGLCLALAAPGLALTEGAHSPERLLLVGVIVIAGSFLPPRIAAVWTALTLLVYASPLLYTPPPDRPAFVAELLVVVPMFSVLCVAAAYARRTIDGERSKTEDYAAGHAALRRVATVVAEAGDPALVHDVVASEAAHLLGADGSAVLRDEGDRGFTMMGGWSRDGSRTLPNGTLLPPAAVVSRRDAAGEPIATRGVPGPGSLGTYRGYVISVGVPIRTGARTWGLLTVGSRAADAFGPDCEDRLQSFAELVGLAVANAEDRARLMADASSDALTGLANRRAFDATLAQYVARAGRQDTPLVVALIDLDHLKRHNDDAGHGAGDLALRAVAGVLGAHAREGDFLARIGGDEFAWLMPDSQAAGAVAAIERARRALTALDGLTFSAGIAEKARGEDGPGIVSRADITLYDAKAAGRNCVRVAAREDGDAVGVTAGAALDH